MKMQRIINPLRVSETVDVGNTKYPRQHYYYMGYTERWSYSNVPRTQFIYNEAILLVEAR